METECGSLGVTVPEGRGLTEEKNVCDINRDKTESSGVGVSKVTATKHHYPYAWSPVPLCLIVCVAQAKEREGGRGEQRV